MNEKTCQRQTLAHGPHCTVERCECGVLHVTCGPITFRATIEMVEALSATLAEALGRVAVDPLTRAMRMPWLTGRLS